MTHVTEEYWMLFQLAKEMLVMSASAPSTCSGRRSLVLSSGSVHR